MKFAARNLWIAVCSRPMANSKTLNVACEHCRSRLTVTPKSDTATHFKCATCGERNSIAVGVALARNLAAEADAAAKRQRSLRRIPAAILVGLLGLAGLYVGSYMQLHDGRPPWAPEPTPVVVVTNYP